MRIAIDTGGTFTDCIYVRDGRLQILKVPSTPADPAQALANALRRILSDGQGGVGRLPGRGELDLVCGTTVGTNALLQRRGGRVTLVTTAGFEDVIEIGRQARPRLYDFFVTRPDPLVPPARRLGVRERVMSNGRVLIPLTSAEAARIVRRVASARGDAVALCLLFCFANRRHEAELARALRARGHAVSVSHEILPEFREYERTATTVINAYLMPVMSRYLGELGRMANLLRMRRNIRRGQQKNRVSVMQSSGGSISARVAAREPVRTVLSGPAGGALGAQKVAAMAGFPRAISFDMGGTSTDVCLIEGELRTSNESQVAGLPVAVPVIDIHTVGAGGGSLARFDRAGALRVGPESAGADPGPICYGRGEQPTVTDAHLILGRLGAEGLLGGEFRLDERRAREWMQRALRRAPGKWRVARLAQGIVDVANATMEKAIRVISVERGYDPRDYTLVAFGGAGGLHACDLASALRMPRVLVPKFPGGLSALGILQADVVRDFSRTVRYTVANPNTAARELEPRFRELERTGLLELSREGFNRNQADVQRMVDARYLGQSYELTVPAAGDIVKAFHRLHFRRFGYRANERPVEIVNVRVRIAGRTPKPSVPPEKRGGASARDALVARRKVYFSGRGFSAAVYDRARLRAGMRFSGPAVVNEYSATTAVPPGWGASVDARGNLLLLPDSPGKDSER